MNGDDDDTTSQGNTQGGPLGLIGYRISCDSSGKRGSPGKEDAKNKSYKLEGGCRGLIRKQPALYQRSVVSSFYIVSRAPTGSSEAGHPPYLLASYTNQTATEGDCLFY